jgi:hypothetical protein
MKRPEQAIHLAVARHLEFRAAPDIYWLHVPNAAKRGVVEGRIFKHMGTKAGVSDLLICRASQLYALELKAENGRVTRVQRECHRELERAGAIVGTAFGIDEALDWLESHQLLRGVTQ